MNTATATEEVTEEWLYELYDEELPPCQMIKPPFESAKKNYCGKPSAYRLWWRCKNCNTSRTRYICKDCFYDIATGRGGCFWCKAYLTEWKIE